MKTIRTAVVGCGAISDIYLQNLKSRFSIIDLLYFTGIWNDAFIKKIFMRAEALDAGL